MAVNQADSRVKTTLCNLSLDCSAQPAQTVCHRVYVGLKVTAHLKDAVLCCVIQCTQCLLAY